ncbi:MAG: LysE family translocator, partial [Cohaesibacteraceae bacterium]|nr:LysE family translocator [Cohaesibacteraceae bacterium]
MIAIGTGANHEFLKALPHVFGATISYTLIVLFSGAGIGAFITDRPNVAQIIQYAGTVYLLYLSYKISMIHPRQSDRSSSEPAVIPPGLLDGALAQGLNPKAWLVAMSGVGLFVAANSSQIFYLAIFGVISFIFCFLGIGAWAMGGRIIGQYLTKPVHHTIFNVTMGGMLAFCVLL